MLQFAYGSNMDWPQMKDRCPTARFVGIAALRDHRLAFTRRSVQRRCGVADAIPEQGKDVWGVVYEIDDVDVGRLDASEGYRPGRADNSYRREERHVFMDDDDQKPMAAFTYIAIPQKDPPLPNAEYKQLIVSGARFWHLPEAYIRELEAIKVSG